MVVPILGDISPPKRIFGVRLLHLLKPEYHGDITKPLIQGILVPKDGIIHLVSPNDYINGSFFEVISQETAFKYT
ncbi:hypothetical protein E2C01_012895 [Portunus trituberculatus]|uniref:Uncharacterized protein n=1 Tax=Portunus trituberculatus TaxID=210409 RepID=A0A5B7DFI1_PORTR|nr:hypothetical protein [Portunus trituberculatus]